MKPFASTLKFSCILLLINICFISNLKASIFYSKGNIAANTRTNWSLTTNGVGASPTTTEWAQATHTYVIQNGHAMTTTAVWSLNGSLQINSGGTLTTSTTNTYTLSIGGTTVVSGTLILRNNAAKIFTGNTTINNGGIITISNSGTVNFNANLSVVAGGTFNHNNTYDNATVYVQVNGDLSIDGTYNYGAFLPAIWMNGSGNRNINTGSTALCKLLLRQADYYANGPVTVNQDFYAMWNQVGGSFHTNGQTVTANWGVVNNGGTFYVDGGSLTVGSTIGGMLIGRTLTQNGDLQVSAGTLNSPGIYLGTTTATPKGSATQSGGIINTNVLDIGNTSSFVQSGGTNNINGSLNLNNSSSTYSHTTGSTTVNVLGNINNNGVYSTAAGIAAINVSGNWINNLTFTTSSTNTVTFQGAGGQSISGTAATSFNHVVINPSAGEVVLSQNCAVVGNLSVLTGIFNLNTYACSRSTAGGVFTMDAGTMLKVAGASGGAGTSNFPNNFATHTFNATSTVEYNGSVNQTIYSVPGYGNLTLSTGGTKTAGGALTVQSDLNINSTALFAGSSFTHVLKGNWYNNVSATAFVPGTSTVNFNGTTPQIIGGTMGSSFYHLIINNANGVGIVQDQIVNGTLTLTAGNLDLGTKNLSLAAASPAVAGSPFSATKMIIADGGGQVRKMFSSIGTYTFPVGDKNVTVEYSPITLNFTSGSFAGGAYASVSLSNAKHANNASTTDFLRRYWTIGNSGISAHSFTATATYASADIAGTEAGIAAAKFTGTLPWVKYGVIGSNTLTTTGVANAGSNIIFTGISNLVPAVSISGGGVSLCPAGTAALGSSVSNNGTGSISYNWTPATGLSSASISNPVASPASTTTYTLIVTDGNGITSTPATTTISINIPATPTVTITEQPTCLVATGTLTITAPVSAGMTYSIDGSNYSNSTGVFAGVSAGIYNITAKNTSGCISGVSVVTVNPQPARPTGVLSGSTTVCSGSVANLTITATGTGTISGTLSDGTVFSGTAPTITFPVYPLITTSYTISTLSNGICTSIAADKTGGATVNVTAAPAASILYAGSPFCWNSGTASVVFLGTAGGVYTSAPSGLAIHSSNGNIDLATSAPGVYTITYTVSAAGGCSSFTANTIVRINPNIWTGQVSSDWNTAANWVSNMVPTPQCPDVTIMSGATYQPVINSGTILVENIFIKAGATLVINNATIQVSGTINNAGSLVISNGTLEMIGTGPQVIPANSFQNNSLKNLVINNTSMVGVTLDGAVDIYGSVSYNGTGKTLITNDHLTLKSTALNTASLGVMTGNTLTGKVTVERYLSAKRAWHLLGVPTNTLQTIKAAWQEGATSGGSIPVNGFGIQISTNQANWAANGFDFNSPNGPSMKRFNHLLTKWEDIGTTHINFPTPASGYMTFARGDRTANGLNSIATQTVLRTKGTLNFDDQAPVVIGPSKFACIANPYASAVDLRNIQKTGLKDFFYVWDPKLSGANGLGAYQTISWNGSNYVVTPGMGSYGANGSIQNFIQSGQAFLVEGTVSGGSLVFKESAKASGSMLASRPVSPDNTNMRVNLHGVSADNSSYLADGVLIEYAEQFTNSFDDFDAYKLGNTNENLSIKNGNRSLSIERKNSPADQDTIFLNLKGLRIQRYSLQINARGLTEMGLIGFVEDNYLNTRSLLDLSTNTTFRFESTTTAASYAPDRFRIVFSKARVLPVSFSSIKAVKKTNVVDVEWKVEQETNIKMYQVERSADGNHFKTVHTTAAKNGAVNIYHWSDSSAVDGDNFYRVRSIDNSGKTSYSKIVKVVSKQQTGTITIFPNPVRGNTVNLQMLNEPMGNYHIRLTNISGQVLLNKVINHKNRGIAETVYLDGAVPKGIYQLEITKPGGEVTFLKMIN